MNDNNDVNNLFDEIGGNAGVYKEISRGERAGEALARWPLLSSLQPGIAKSAGDSMLAAQMRKPLVQVPPVEPVPVEQPRQPQAIEAAAQSAAAVAAPTFAVEPPRFAGRTAGDAREPFLSHRAAPEPVAAPEEPSGAPAFSIPEGRAFAGVSVKQAEAPRHPGHTSQSLSEKLALKPLGGSQEDRLVEPAYKAAKTNDLQAVFQRLLGAQDTPSRPETAGRDGLDRLREEPAVAESGLAQRLNRL